MIIEFDPASTIISHVVAGPTHCAAIGGNNFGIFEQIIKIFKREDNFSLGEKESTHNWELVKTKMFLNQF